MGHAKLGSMTLISISYFHMWHGGRKWFKIGCNLWQNGGEHMLFEVWLCCLYEQTTLQRNIYPCKGGHSVKNVLPKYFTATPNGNKILLWANSFPHKPDIFSEEVQFIGKSTGANRKPENCCGFTIQSVCVVQYVLYCSFMAQSTYCGHAELVS